MEGKIAEEKSADFDRHFCSKRVQKIVYTFKRCCVKPPELRFSKKEKKTYMSQKTNKNFPNFNGTISSFV